ncbi:MAG: glycerophosphoryl diester phosphodiesterase membrane domain-containing protein [Planctomycetota bacterium]|nr:glycerophosphoryl diester phosphodiesterase membrane domain-containing protein [Planctomycetota bacterium]
MKIDIRNLVRTSWRTFRAQLVELVAFSLMFEALFFLVLAPFANWVWARLISSTGHLALGNEQIVVFLLSPTGAAAILFLGTIVLAVEFAKHTGLVWIITGDLHGSPTNSIHALREMGRRFARLVELGLRQFAIMALWIGPVLAAGGALYLLLTRNHDIYYLITERPPLFWVGAVLGVVLALFGLFLFVVLRARWIYSVPLLLLEDQAPSAAMSRSRELMKGNTWRVARIYLGVALILLLGGAIGFELLYVLGAFIANEFAGSVEAVIGIAGTLVLLNLFWAAALAFLGPITDALIVTHYYRDQCEPELKAAAELPARRSRAMPFLVVVTILVCATVLSRVVAELVYLDRTVEVTAHRGASLDAPENSLSALKKAIEVGADYAEIDVQELADGHIVLIHDTDLRRIAGLSKNIWEVDLPEIQGLDAGSWFAPEFKGERIPTLDEAIDLVRGRMRLNIELKVHGHEKNFVPSVVRIIEKQHFESQCVVSSLSHEVLVEVSKLNSELKLGFIVFQGIGALSRLEVDFRAGRTALATRRLIRRARRRGLQIHVWTVNDIDAMHSFIDLRVANIMTDRPGVLKGLLVEREKMGDQERILWALHNWWKR